MRNEGLQLWENYLNFTLELSNKTLLPQLLNLIRHSTVRSYHESSSYVPMDVANYARDYPSNGSFICVFVFLDAAFFGSAV